MDNAFSKTDIVAEIMTDLYNATQGPFGKHDHWYDIRTNSVRNRVCLQLCVKDGKQKLRDTFKLIETTNNVSEIFN